MSERYTKLFALSENLYAETAPVVIAAGALLKDNQTGKVIAQIKMRSISGKRIKAAKISVVPLDTVGNVLGDAVQYQYLDLNVGRNEDFGAKAPIALPDAATRGFSASVEEIAFVDNTVWKSSGEQWKMLPNQQPLGLVHSLELEKQFHIKFGHDYKYVPLVKHDLWFCACGALNHSKEADCHTCRRSLAVLNSIDIAELNREKDARLAAEKEQADRAAEAARIAAEEARIAAEAAKVRAKKNGKIAAIVIPIVAVIVVAAVLISGMIKKNNAYNDALALMDAEQYEQAIAAFATLDGYKDSSEKIRIAENVLAEEKRAEEEAKRAAEMELSYNNALQLLETGVAVKENEAYQLLVELGDYKDVSKFLEDFQCALIVEELDSDVDTSDTTQFYEYDSTGRLIQKKYDGGATLSYVYNENGIVTKESWDDWRSTEYWYDENGILEKTKHAFSRNSSGKVSYVTREYNQYGHPIRIDDEFDDCTWTFAYDYADNGEVTAVNCTVNNSTWGLEKTLTVNLAQIDDNVKLFNDVTSRWIDFKGVSDNGKKSITYNVAQYLLSPSIVKSQLCEYDAQGNLTGETLYSLSGEEVFVYRYENTYDEMGNLVEVKRNALNSDIEVVYTYVYGYIYTPDAT